MDSFVLKKAAVTGARGLIGLHIVKKLLMEGWHVRVLSRHYDGVTEHQNIQVVVADITDGEALANLLNDVSAVFHCAAEIHDESRMHEVNVAGTLCLLRTLAETPSVRYFCYLSSAGVVGPAREPIVNELSVCHPSSIYEKTKYEAEKMVADVKLDMSVCILRPANVFDTHKLGLVSLPLRNSFRDRFLVFLRGNEGAHLVHAKDVSSAAIFFIDKKFQKPEVFFVSYDDEERNTVAGVFRLFRSLSAGGKSHGCFSLPNSIPYMIRKLRKGVSLHGQTRFSGKKLADAGFVFPMGLEASIMGACCRDKADKS